MGHCCGTLLWDTLKGHSCETLLRDTVAGHSCGTLLWDTHLEHSCGTLLWDPLAGHSCGSLLWDNLVGHSCGTLLWVTLVGNSCRKLLWDTLAGHCGTLLRDTLASPQNERFVRDFLKNSHVKVCKTIVSHETSSKSPAETPIGAHTSRSPAKQFRDSSPSKRHPLTRQSQCDSDIHLYHNSQPPDSLRLPGIFPRPHV